MDEMAQFRFNYLSHAAKPVKITLFPTEFDFDNVSILLELKPYLKKDFFILPYNLILDQYIFDMIDYHNEHESLVTNLLLNPTTKLGKGLPEVLFILFIVLFCLLC